MKKLLSIIIVFCMILCMMPLTVSADDVTQPEPEPVDASVNGVAVPEKGGNIVGKGIEGKVSYDSDSKTLTLENATITATDDNRSIYNERYENYIVNYVINIISGVDTIKLIGKNQINWSNDAVNDANLSAIHSRNSLTIKGSSREDSLEITLTPTARVAKITYNSYAIYAECRSSINDCTLDIVVCGGSKTDGYDSTSDSNCLRGSYYISNTNLNLIIGKDRSGNIQPLARGAVISGDATMSDSDITIGAYSNRSPHDAINVFFSSASFTNCTLNGELDMSYRESCYFFINNTAIKNSSVKIKSSTYIIRGSDLSVDCSDAELIAGRAILNNYKQNFSYENTYGAYTSSNGNITFFDDPTSINSYRAIKNLNIIAKHEHCICGGNVSANGHTTHENIEWKPWISTDTLPNEAGNWRLVNDVTVDNTHTINNGAVVNLCLNGKTIKGADTYNDLVNITGNAQLNLCDCTKKGRLEGSALDVVSIGSLSSESGTGVFNLYSGTVSASSVGGSLSVLPTGTANLYGGCIESICDIHDNAKLNILGNADIKRIGLSTDAKFNIPGTLNSATPISVSTKHKLSPGEAIVISDPNNTDYSSQFTSENEAYIIQYNSLKQLELVFKEYNVTYAPGANGTGAQKSETKYHGFPLTLSDAAFERDGYEQSGWSITDDGEKVYELNEEYTENEAIVLYPVWHDITNPVIDGLTDNKTYCGNIDFTVSDNGETEKVTLNGETVFADSNGKYTLTPSEEAQNVIVYDKAGNTAEVTVTVNDGHTYEWQSENGMYWKKCKFCNDETDKKAIPEIIINGADRVCKTQDYIFNVTMPDDIKKPDYGYSFTDLGDGGIELTESSGIVKAEWYSTDDDTFTLTVSAETSDGFRISTDKIITVQKEHSGGTATCTAKAVCEVCGESYGELDENNHTDELQWITNEKEHTQKYKCCGATVVDTEAHNWENGVCTKCAYTCAHRGGTAYCTAKAVCEVCGESYGELSFNNHSALKHINAKAATETAEGNIEHWYCESCDKYYSDASATKEITKAETLISKLPRTPEAPQSGDNISLAIWFVLLFISGATFVLTVLSAKNKGKYAR